MRILLSKLEKWAKEYYGLFFYDHNHVRIQEQLKLLLHAQNMDENSFIQSLYRGQKDLVKATLDILTVQESYFFRDKAFYDYLKEQALPQLILKKRQEKTLELRIWSAGCARGEEIYSLAILLRELLPDIHYWKLHLIGTDIHQVALEQARQARFTKGSLRAVDAARQNTYFVEEDNTYLLLASIRDMVQFAYCNLVELKQHRGSYDLIICRNVFIYLTSKAIRGVVDYFYQSLLDGGSLFLGSVEYPHQYQNQFSLCVREDVCFLKKESCPQEVASIKIPQPAPSTAKIELASIKEHLAKKNFDYALDDIQHYVSKWGENSLLFRYQGEALLGKNELVQALWCFNKAIQEDPLDAIPHFLKGLIEVDGKDLASAMVSMQKALCLRNHFPEAAYYLGLLYLQVGRISQGQNLLKKALAFTQKNPHRSILYTSGTREQFMHAVRSSIAYYGGLQHEEQSLNDAKSQRNPNGT